MLQNNAPIDKSKGVVRVGRGRKSDMLENHAPVNKSKGAQGEINPTGRTSRTRAKAQV